MIMHIHAQSLLVPCQIICHLAWCDVCFCMRVFWFLHEPRWLQREGEEAEAEDVGEMGSCMLAVCIGVPIFL
jgi:hypothetical protein